MSDLKAILDATKRIESILEQQCGGHGRGMHEKLSNVQLTLPEPLVRRVRYIASVRNKVVHEAGYDIEDMPAFLQTCTRTADALEALAATTPLAGQQEPANALHGARAQRRRWWVLLVLLGLMVWWGWQSFHSTRSAPRLQRPDGATRSATAPSPAPAPAAAAPHAAMAAGASPAAATPTSTSGAATAVAAAPVRMADLGLHYGHDAFHMPEAQIRITLTNNAQGTLSQLWLHARLYVNGERTPVLDTASARHATPLLVHLGEHGLRAGATRTFTVTADRMGHSNWLAPDVLNARTRRLEVVVERYTDGRNQQHPASGPTLSTSAQAPEQASAQSPAAPHQPAVPADQPAPHSLCQGQF